jgi:serine/threonine protein kinase
MDGAPSPALEQSLLRWFPISVGDDITLVQHEHFSETDLRDISDVLRRVGRGSWSRIPRIYAVLRLLDRLDVIDLFLAQSISDVYFPFAHQTLPQSLNPSVAHAFLELQRVVLSSALDLERETGRHRHFSSSDDVPFIKIEELGKGAYGFVDRVISTVSHREYARKLIRRGRTFQRDQKILKDFERELGTLKKLSHHRHIVQLIGSYTDPRYVGLIMTPVAECDLKEFLNSCGPDGKSNPQSRKSFMRSFFGCLTSALSYLHDNTIRHKDIKPQNVLVAQHTVYLTDFGISLDWSEVGKETTTGPTPRTARYCAPEVYENAPRNTASDMWSLGCIFLEIWTVLKGETVADLYAFLEESGALSSCYHLNRDTTFKWMDKLMSNPSLADNLPLSWIRHLLVEDKQSRWTARELLLQIETVNNNPETKFAFSGQCCMEELETTESVVSSSGSLHENGSIAPVLRVAPSVSAPESISDRNDRPRSSIVASRLQNDATPSHSDDNTSDSLTTSLTKGSIVVASTLDLLHAETPKDEAETSMAPSEGQEMKLQATGRGEVIVEYDRGPLNGRNVGPDRVQSTRPEWTPADKFTVAPFSISTSQPLQVDEARFKSYASEAEGSIFTSVQTHATLKTPKQARSDVLGDMPAAKSNKLMRQTSEVPSITVENTSSSNTSGDVDLQRKLRSSKGEAEDEPTSFASESPWSLADQPQLIQKILSNEHNPSDSSADSNDAQDKLKLNLPPHLQKAPIISPITTQSLDDTLVNEVATPGQSRPVSSLEPQALTTEALPNTADERRPLPLPAKRRDSDAFSFQSEAEELSRPELHERPPTVVVPYSAPEKPAGKKRICARCHEPMAGQFVRALGGTYHLECFTCTVSHVCSMISPSYCYSYNAQVPDDTSL